ncbi:T9SS type A sorting domain-containing protein [Tenacibaculum sp. ZS6-P6]|uniref:T9SS type A sorting domain-containing protein n=1 Tax=Tenacibaculum sp. ZS6-P6 TaxID=3447503 RepID=UPI003F9A2D16
MKNKLLILLFMSQLGFGQITFDEKIIVDEFPQTKNAKNVYVSDIDGDGDKDVISISESISTFERKLTWFENIDGLGTYFSPHVITTSGKIHAIYITDLDGDGDEDILTTSLFEGTISWYENEDGFGTFSNPQIITTSGNSHFIYATDIDFDGDMDVLAISYAYNMITWYENTNGQGVFGSRQVMLISTSQDISSAYIADIDSDGDMDAILASNSDDVISWSENINGSTYGNPQVIDNFEGISTKYATDLDGDGDMDIIAYSYNQGKLVWYENTDGQGAFGNQQIIANITEDIDIYAADVDNDGDMDVLVSLFFADKIVWYENINGQGAFGSQQIITNNTNTALSVLASDINNDGNIDVFSASSTDDKIAWYENLDGQGTFGNQQTIGASADGVKSVYSTDVDGDGDMDIISASENDNRIAWYENINGEFNYGNQHIITTDAIGAKSVHATDLDGDGDNDVLCAFYTGIAWYRNIDGLGNFETIQYTGYSSNGYTSIYSSDIDADGDMDIITASYFDNKIVWHENNGFGIMVSQQNITTIAEGASSVYSTDIDGDGDMDVLSASENDNKIAWYENLDGQGTFGAQQIITTNAYGASSIYSIDIDGDGDMDILSASRDDDKIAWYENTNGQGVFGTQQIITTIADGASSVYAIDIDNDGDKDVISASGNDDKIAWYENTNGQGVFGAQQIITTNVDNPSSVYAIDIDNDNNIDVLSASFDDDKIIWYKNTQGSLSIEEYSKKSVLIYPNPTHKMLNIKTFSTIKAISIYDLNGRLLNSIQLSLLTLDYQLNVNDLPNSIYFLEVEFDNSKQVIKFIKK